jgi:hypothetical protein
MAARLGLEHLWAAFPAGTEGCEISPAATTAAAAAATATAAAAAVATAAEISDTSTLRPSLSWGREGPKGSCARAGSA